MTNVVHNIAVDIARGFEQKDPRWAAWSGIYGESQDLFAFWDIVSTSQLGKADLRSLVKDQNKTPIRPGRSPSDAIAPFTTKDPIQPDQLTMDPERVARIHVVKRAKKTTEQSVTGLKVIGERRDKHDQVVQIVTPQVDFGGLQTLFSADSFLLQSVNENFQEKFEIRETFGEPVFFAFGERQKIFQYGGVLLDTESWAWKEKFLLYYDQYLRGSKAIENQAMVILTTNSAIVRGYLLSCGISQNETTHGFVGFTFAMFVQSRIPINDIRIQLSPEDIKTKQDEDPQLLVYTISDLVSKPNGALKTLSLTGGSVEPASGFTEQNFNQTAPVPPTHFKAGSISLLGVETNGEVAGVKAAPLAITFSPAGQASYSPPDLVFSNPVPSAYNGQAILGTLGTIADVIRTDLAAYPAGYTTFSMGCTEADSARRTVQSGQRFYYRAGEVQQGGQDHSVYTNDQVTKMQALAKENKLAVKIRIKGSDAPAIIINVKSLNRFGEGGYHSGRQDGVPLNLCGDGRNASIPAFDIVLEDPILMSIQPEYVFWMEIYERNTFKAGSPLIQNFFHIYETTKARSVGGQDGTTRAFNSAEKHVLIDPAATFLADLQANFDLGDSIYVTLPYEVVDEDFKDSNGATIPTTSAKVKVYSILSDTQLQLGRLTKLPINKTDVRRQWMGKIPLATYTVVVERTNTIKLIEPTIKKRVKDPANGAFNKVDLAVASLVQPRGVFKMEQGVHYTT